MRRTAARVALVLLALSGVLALGGASGASAGRLTADASAGTTRSAHDHAHAVATVAVTGTEWATHQLRDPSGPDRSVAVLLAVAALAIGRRRWTVAAVRDDLLGALRCHGSGIRGPPAFA